MLFFLMKWIIGVVFIYRSKVSGGIALNRHSIALAGHVYSGP